MTLFVLVVLQEVGDGAQVLSRFLQLSDLLAQNFQLGLLASQHFVNIFHGSSCGGTVRRARHLRQRPKVPSHYGSNLLLPRAGLLSIFGDKQVGVKYGVAGSWYGG